MKRMNKLLSVFLSVLLVVGIVPLTQISKIDLSLLYPNAAAEESGIYEENRTVEYYSEPAFTKMDRYLATYENKADAFDYYKYLGEYLRGSYVTNLINLGIANDLIGESYVYDMVDNDLFNAAYAVWKVSGYITNPIDAVYDGVGISSLTYYESIILKCLEKEIKNDNLIDTLNKACIKNTTSLLKSFFKARSAVIIKDYADTVNTSVTDLDEESYNYLCEQAEKMTKSKLEDSVKTISDWLKTAGTVEKFAERIASYVALSELSDSMADYLSVLAHNSSISELSYACNEISAIITDGFDSILGDALFNGVTSIGKQFIGKKLNEVWTKGILGSLNNGVLSTGAQITNSALLAIALTRTVSDICFSTTKQLDDYEKLICLVNFMNLQRNTLTGLINNTDDSPESIIMLLNSLNLLYGTYSAGSDLTKTAISTFKDNFISFSSDEEYNEAIKATELEKSYYNKQYSDIMKNIIVSWIGEHAYGIVTDQNDLLILGYGDTSASPWNSRVSEIQNIYISSGITALCDNLFSEIQLHDVTVVMDGVNSIGAGTFAKADTTCNLVFSGNINYSGSAVVYPSLYIYGNINMTNYSTWELYNIYCKGDSFLSDSTINFNSECIINGTATFSQWSKITVRNNALLVCNKLVGRAWAYSDSYRTGITTYGTVIVTEKAYGYINLYGDSNGNFIAKSISSSSIIVNSGNVSVYGESTFAYQNDASLSFFGDTEYTFIGLGACTAKSIDVYVEKLTLEGNITITSYIDFHGKDVNIQDQITLRGDAIAKEGSNYKNVILPDGYKIASNITAANIRFGRNITTAPGKYTLTGNVYFGEILSGSLTVSANSELAIDGDLRGSYSSYLTYTSGMTNNGIFSVSGNTTGGIYFGGNGTYYFGGINLTRCSIAGTVYISKDVVGLNGCTNAKIVFCGNQVQTVTHLCNFGICEITNNKGVVFVNRVNSTILFNHNLNPFTLQNGGSFVDYDKDGLKDNVDPLPLLAQSFDTNVLSDLSVSMKLHSGNCFDEYYWEITDISDGYVEIEIPSVIGDIPVKIVDDIFSSNENLRSITLYPGLYSTANLSVDNKSVIIRGYTGSSAEKFAHSQGLQFESIGNITSISINTEATKQDFTINDTFTSDGLLINVFADDGNEYVTDDVEVSGFDNAPGLKTINIKYANAETTYTVAVSEYAYSYLNDNEISIINYYGTDTELIVPNDICGRVVKDISSLGTLENTNKITLPNSLASISPTAFNNATSLMSIYVDENSENFISEDGILYSKDRTQVIRCPIAIENKIFILPDDVIEINDYAFANVGLTFVVLPESLQMIRSYAFSNNNITTVTIPENVTRIERNSFEKCSNLTEINYNAENAETGISATSTFAQILIGSQSVFYSDSAVQTVNIGKSVQSLSPGLFVSLTGLNTINIASESELTSIAKYTFLNDSSLSDIYYGRYYKYWKQITIADGNTPITNATLHCVECDECAWDNGAITTAATCIATGEKLFTCTVCEKERKEIIAIDPNNHAGDTSLINQKEPTCTQEGYTGDTICSDCKVVLESGTSIPKKDHTWDSGTVTQPASCTESGIKTFNCTNCTATRTETIDALGHDVSTEWTIDKEPTCTESGSKSHHCSRCDFTTDITVIDALGHSWDQGEITTPATCTGTGIRTFTCSVCQETRTEIVDEIGHDYGNWTEVDENQHQRICKNDSSHIEKDDHSWNDGVVTQAASCTEDGIRTYTCSVCSATKTSAINALGHKYGSWTKLDNNQHQRICENNSSHIEKENHSWNDGTVTKAATCTETGIRTFNCTVCGAKKTESIKATGHNYGAWTIVKAPTCTAEGVEQRVCSNDNKHVETRPIAKSAHVDNDGDGYCDNCHTDLGFGSETQESNCVCGKYHTGPFAGIIKFFHRIVYFFKNLFNKN